MDKCTCAKELLERLKEMTDIMEEWTDDTFFLAQEHAQQLQESLESICED